MNLIVFYYMNCDVTQRQWS